MYRTDIRQPTVRQAFTITSNVSVGMTVAGVDGQCLYLAQVRTWYVGVAQQVPQLLRIFDGADEIFRSASIAGLEYNLLNPIRIREGNNLVVTSSVTAVAISGAISLLYYFDER